MIDIDGAHPVRSVFRLLGAHRKRVLTAVAFFTMKDVPLWLMPVITGKVIDVVVAGGPTSELWLWAAIAVVALVQNYPNHVQWTKLFMGAVREIGADLRNGLTSRLQSLSIGFHTRVSASIVQTKVVRDVENVEVMLQQIAHPLLSATMVMLGAIVMTALAVPEFLPVYALTIPLAVLLRFVLARAPASATSRSAARSSTSPPASARWPRSCRSRARTVSRPPRRSASPSAPRACGPPGTALDVLNGRFASL